MKPNNATMCHRLEKAWRENMGKKFDEKEVEFPGFTFSIIARILVICEDGFL